MRFRDEVMLHLLTSDFVASKYLKGSFFNGSSSYKLMFYVYMHNTNHNKVLRKLVMQFLFINSLHDNDLCKCIDNTE